MDNFISYLNNVQNRLKNLKSEDEIHIVIGNESCDMDSSASALILAYFLHKHKIPKIPPSALVVPVQSVSYENFLLRSDNCLVFREAKIPLDKLVYRDELDFAELCRKNKVTSTLVDHHVLSETNEALKDTVVQIFDHRPRDPAAEWNEKQVEVNIQQVGSCSTLITQKILAVDEALLFKELAYMLYETIVFDTVALLPENGRTTELDLQITKKLEDKFQIKEDSQLLYKKLWRAHIDISHLTLAQMLEKDMKIVEGIPVPGVSMLVANFLNMKGAHAAIENFAAEHKASFVVLIGLEASDGVKRDVALYWNCGGENLKERVLKKLWDSQKLKGYDFLLSEVTTGFHNIVCLRVNNVKLSRKQIVPLIKDAVVESRG